MTALLTRFPPGNVTSEKKLTRQESLSTIRQRKQEFRGMFACKKGDDSKLVKRLITQLKTEHVTGSELFVCFERYSTIGINSSFD
jgi:hypothetical protein